MKTNRKGKIILQRGDYRTGNFIFHDEGTFIKVMAVSGIVSWRVLAASAIGQMVAIALKNHHDNWLRTYAAMNFSQLLVVPDTDYFTKHADIVNAQTQKHPELYGIDSDVSEDEDNRILKEEKELRDAVEEVAR